MGRLLLITQPQLQPGYQLAGVQAYAASDAETAASLIEQFLADDETGLLGVDEKLLEELGAELRLRMDEADRLPYIALPSGEPTATTLTAQQMVSEMIRRTVGFQLTFSSEE